MGVFHLSYINFLNAAGFKVVSPKSDARSQPLLCEPFSRISLNDPTEASSNFSYTEKKDYVILQNSVFFPLTWKHLRKRLAPASFVRLLFMFRTHLTRSQTFLYRAASAWGDKRLDVFVTFLVFVITFFFHSVGIFVSCFGRQQCQQQMSNNKDKDNGRDNINESCLHEVLAKIYGSLQNKTKTTTAQQQLQQLEMERLRFSLLIWRQSSGRK